MQPPQVDRAAKQKECISVSLAFGWVSGNIDSIAFSLPILLCFHTPCFGHYFYKFQYI